MQLNSNYDLVYNVSAIGHEYADAHEFFLTPHCTAVFTSYHHRAHNLSEFNITDGYIIDNSIQEVDLATNTLLFEWRASDHIPLSDTYLFPNMSQQGHSPGNAMDFFHMNSIEKDDAGNYLISARHTHALYYIDGRTGSILWALGGKRNDFTDLSNNTATNFAWQHHARWASPARTAITLFDNRDSKYEFAPDYLSRGVILTLDQTAKTVALTAEYRSPSNITAIREGSMQLLSDSAMPGNVLLGWGNEPAWTEYAANGTIVWDVRLGPLNLDRQSADNYRALKVNWTAAPQWSPKIAAGPAEADLLLPLAEKLENVDAGRNDTAYFSWNGATDVETWVILASTDRPELGVGDVWKVVPKSGFESSVFVGGEARFVRALAVATNGSVVGVSDVLDMVDGKVTEIEFDVEAFERETRKIMTSETRALGALAIVLGVGALIVFYLRSRRVMRAYPQVSGRKRSDTLDSKMELAFTINVVDCDEENALAGKEEMERYRDDESK